MQLLGVSFGALAFVFVAGLITAIATGFGALPFFLYDEISQRWNVVLWGVASGIMVSASVFGLIGEGLANGTVYDLAPGIVAGVLLVIVADWVIDRVDFGEEEMAENHVEEGHDIDPDHAEHAHEDGQTGAEPAHAEDRGHSHDEHAMEARAIAEGDFKKLILILGILTVHSFPEGVAIGVSFADLNVGEAGIAILGFSVPILAIFMTIAISIHNVPEGVAISIPLRSLGMSNWRMVGAAIFSSLPQPIGAVIAYVFVVWAREFLPFGFGFAAGAMIYLVLSEFIPEALETGRPLPGKGYKELIAGLAAGVAVMVPLAFV